MKLYPSNRSCCDADVVAETTVRQVPRGNPPTLRAAKQIHHYRARDEARFWHWSDVEVTEPDYTALGLAIPSGIG